jgi:hypothetical protein
MKKLFIMLLLLTQTLVSLTEGSEKIFGAISPNEKIIIKQGSQGFTSHYGFSIRLDSIYDSRCPKPLKCFLAGNVRLKFVFISNKGDKTNFVLNSLDSNQYVLINGYKISLRNLMPYPTTTYLIQQKDYEAEIIIQKK